MIAVTAPFATPAALVCMKLHAIQDRAGASADKRAGDALDIHQLLTRYGTQAIGAEIRGGPPGLIEAVDHACRAVLIEGADRTRNALRVGTALAATITADELRYLGAALRSAIS